jgi:hypothetical protein
MQSLVALPNSDVHGEIAAGCSGMSGRIGQTVNLGNVSCEKVWAIPDSFEGSVEMSDVIGQPNSEDSIF